MIGAGVIRSGQAAQAGPCARIMNNWMSRLSLWTFAADTPAQRLYVREGGQEVRRIGGGNEENLPDIRYAREAT